jgi:hypothetical protein
MLFHDGHDEFMGHRPKRLREIDRGHNQMLVPSGSLMKYLVQNDSVLTTPICLLDKYLLAIGINL